MNDISAHEQRPADLPTVLYHSQDIGEIVKALAEAQKSIRNPLKNKTVHIQPRTGRPYEYSYASLDQAIEAVRKHLADNGMITTAIISGQRLVTMLAHTSGQWFKADSPLSYDGGPQAMGSASTFARRYHLMGLLALAAEDDDDGVGASNGLTTLSDEEAAARKKEWDRREAQKERGDAVLHPIQEMARLVTDAAGAVEIMVTWAREANDIEKLRTDPDWRQLLLETSAAVARGLGRIPGAAWKSAVLATKRADMEAIDVTWNGTWKAEIAALEQDHPEAFRALKDHMMANYKRVTGGASAPPPPPPTPSGTTSQSRQTATPAATPSAPADDGQGPSANLFGHHIYDADGEAISDLHTDAVSWSREYFAVMEAADPDGLDYLVHHNTEAMLAALDSGMLNPTATAALRASLEPALGTPQTNEPINTALQILVPQTPAGNPDYMTYQRKVDAALRKLTNPDDLLAWIRANAPIITALPERAQQAPRQLIVFRRNELGIPGTTL